jgi:serine/threonine protein kinase/lipoprotein NlpI
MDFGFDDPSEDSRDSRRLANESFSMQRARKRELLDELRSGWVEGRPARPEEFLDRWPNDPDGDPDVASLLLEDYFQRRRRGQETSLSDYHERFPEQTKTFEKLLAKETVLRSMGHESDGVASPLRLPDVGDDVFGFRLCRPLGEGAFARVFLAEQADLAGRPVVLKVSDIEGTEPQTLAQLLHTNIVPIYSLHEDRRAGLRAVCMPYLGGASLSAVLSRLWTDSRRVVSGEALVRALESVEASGLSLRGEGAGTRGQGPETRWQGPGARGQGPEARGEQEPRQTSLPSPLASHPSRLPKGRAIPLAGLRTMSYERAAAWIVAQLAEGLHHAHQRGILHRDIKPSNILISAEGQPLLLDFNLAQTQDVDPAHATIGGTVAYMAPEHLRALVGRTPALIGQVDCRSDIYSLGMVLAEMLTGHRPFDQSGSYSALPVQIKAMAVERSQTVPSIRRDRPDLSWGLESIARKCLAPEPSRRYQQAGHLADDLRRLLEDRPLKYAPELSRVERARKFARRHPRLASSASVATAAVLVLLAVGTALAAARSQLADARSRDLLHQHDEGVLKALCLVNTRLEMQDHLRAGIIACERTLALFGAPEDPDWERNDAWLRLGPEERRRVAEDRRELLLLLADARVRQAAGTEESSVQALRLLDRAESIPGLLPSRALWLDRAGYRTLRGETELASMACQRAEETPATTARDHYLIAASLVRQGGRDQLRAAIAELDEALRLNPRHYWSLVQRGICHLERGELIEAAGDFGQCTGIWPEFAWGYFNRGCVLDRVGSKAAAILDYTAALQRDPVLVPAYANRGLARLELKQHAAALGDFDRARDLGANDAIISTGRGIALEGLGRHDEADAAFAQGFARAEADSLPAPTRARLAWAYGFAISARDAVRARAAFGDALRFDPRNAQAFYGRAMIAMGRGEDAGALRDFDRAIEADPSRNEARRYRAILLARQGDWKSASLEINQCLQREPRSPATLYAAACVAARAFGVFGTTASADQSLDLLDRALAEGANRSRAEQDPDLAALRRLPRFRRLVSLSQDSGAASSSVPP